MVEAHCSTSRVIGPALCLCGATVASSTLQTFSRRSMRPKAASLFPLTLHQDSLVGLRQAVTADCLLDLALATYAHLHPTRPEASGRSAGRDTHRSVGMMTKVGAAKRACAETGPHHGLASRLAATFIVRTRGMPPPPAPPRVRRIPSISRPPSCSK